jgi:hypothetical protein
MVSYGYNMLKKSMFINFPLLVEFLIFFINVPVTIAMPKHNGDARVTNFIAAKTAKPMR